ncbi:MAG: RidA family protein [Actinomycetota bacterium]|nr:RidA family protein [Actinomycetota bacterium]
MSPEDKLKELGIELPAPAKPLGIYVPALRTGNLVYLSGMLPLKGGTLVCTGKLGGGQVDIAQGALAARTAAINAIAALKAEIENLEKVKRCVRLSGYVASTPDFTDQPKVVNGASELIGAVFGEKGRHTRIAVGVASLPLGSPVELDFIFEISD